MAWHERRGAEVLLRLSGCLLLSGVWLAVRALVASVTLRGAVPAPADFALAAVAFLGGSGGVVLTLLGTHIFDPVDLPARWSRLEFALDDVNAERLRHALREHEERRRL